MDQATLERICLGPDDLVRDVIARIGDGEAGIAIVVDAQRRLLGTVTDGDVRRGLLAGSTLEDRVSDIMFKSPRTAAIGSTRDAQLEIMRSAQVKQLPLVDGNGIVQALVLHDDLVGGRKRPNWVVLMAGGLGQRLRPLTEHTPKPLLQIGGKPILQKIIENARDSGFEEIVICVNYLGDQIRDHFGDGRNLGVNIEYIEETKRLGTAGALSLLPSRPAEPIVVMNGDILTSVNIAALVDFHIENQGLATMALNTYNYEVPFGVVQLDGLKIDDIVEKPTQKLFVNAGIYALSPEALDLVPQDEFFDMPTLFGELIKKRNAAIGFPIHEYWLDIGRPGDLEIARKKFSED